MQDVGVCYAFVEFEDMSGVQNAVKVQIRFLSSLPFLVRKKRKRNVVQLILFTLESLSIWLLPLYEPLCLDSIIDLMFSYDHVPFRCI